MRRKRQQEQTGNGLLVRIVIVCVLAILLLGGGYLYYREGTLPVNSDSRDTTVFVVEQGESLDSIISKLHKQDLIRNKLAFFTIVKTQGIDRNIQAGTFRLSPSLSAVEIANALTHGGSVDQWVLIIEGQRKEEVAQVIGEVEGFEFSEVDFVANAQEGYLFPDKYLIPVGATTEEILQIMTDNFNNKVTDEIRAQIEEKGLTFEEGLTLASMVEREARTEESRQKVASIMLKRIEDEMKLDIDATVQYAVGYSKEEQTWWKQGLTFDDLEVDSPYNTYTNPGIPPGPICNPSLSSIRAVANADPSIPYYFYLTDPQGRMHYGVTNDEHNENIKKYLK